MVLNVLLEVKTKSKASLEGDHSPGNTGPQSNRKNHCKQISSSKPQSVTGQLTTEDPNDELTSVEGRRFTAGKKASQSDQTEFQRVSLNVP